MANLTNLLPEDRARLVTRDYFLRLGTVVLSALAILLVIHAALLVPSYIFLAEEVNTREAHLADIAALFASSEERAVSERTTTLTAGSDAVLALSSLPSTTSVVRSLLALPHAGVSITGFAVTPALDGGEARMSVTGVASTRESLRRYHDALNDLPFVTKADLPLSVYASEGNIPFTVTLTGTLTP